MMRHTEIDWGFGGIRVRPEPATRSRSTSCPATCDASSIIAARDYRDLTIADLAEENGYLRECLALAEQRDAELRAWDRSYRELAHRATAMLACVTYDRDLKARQVRERERHIRELMGAERNYGDGEGATDAAA